jgi:hypothetical protein
LGAFVSFPALGFAILVGIGVLPPVINEIIYFTGVGFLLIGFLIISFSVYEFPPFYEFEWRENLLKLFIINEKTQESIYYYDFDGGFKDEIEKLETDNDLSHTDRIKLHSGGILGIESIITSLTNTKNDKINRIEQKDSIILLTYSSIVPYITYALMIKKDLLSSEHLLDSIKHQFEVFYHEILLNLDNLKGNQELLFGSFNVILRSILTQ